MEDIGIQQQDAERLNHWINTTSGMLLVAGPTGSGKTTTLYVLLHRLKMLEAHIVTLEEPVEYQVPGINQIQIDAQRGLDFTHGTQSLLRLDPDHVLIGELRAPESAEAAIDVVSSGRSLMATLHSKDAISTVSSLRKMGVSDYDIAGNLSIVIAQRLVRRLCPECKSETVTPERFREVLHRCGESVPKTVWQANGCSQCKGIGYSGRLSIYELWQPTESDKTNIIKHQDEFSLRRSVAANGQRFMLQDGIDKAQSGQTTLEELVRIGVLAPVLENQES
jgi:type II secretory ATPase GspE/PulE/Tfp pilus assembly ATPase PilB-like protein